MRGRDIRLNENKQPPPQPMAPHLGLPKGFLQAVVEDVLVPSNLYFLVRKPLPWYAGWP